MIFANIKFNIAPKLQVAINTLVNKGESDTFVYWRDGETMLIGVIQLLIRLVKNCVFIDPVLTYLGGSGGEHKLIGRYFSINNNVANDQSQNQI